jgi:hypothetical protein
MEGIADHDCGHGEAAAETGDGAKVFARVAAALQREDGLGGEAEFVADGNTDAFAADIEAEIAGMG